MLVHNQMGSQHMFRIFNAAILCSFQSLGLLSQTVVILMNGFYFGGCTNFLGCREGPSLGALGAAIGKLFARGFVSAFLYVANQGHVEYTTELPRVQARGTRHSLHGALVCAPFAC